MIYTQIKKMIAFPFFTGMFLTAGIAHFAFPYIFVEAMPDYLPFPFVLNALVGVIEITLALGFWTRYRKIAVRASIVLLGVFLIVIHVWHVQIGRFPGFPQVPIFVLWLRLIIQLMLMYWLWQARNIKPIFTIK